MTKKLSIFCAVLVLSSIGAGAQEKIPSKVVTSDYNRNSVSLVSIQRGDSNDSETTQAVNSYNLSGKFDINNISAKTLRIRKSRDESVSQSEVDEVVAATPYAQQILASIFNRQADGTMDDKTVRYRGNYDAKDQDVINARASRVGTDALGDLGHALVRGSYIVVSDFYNIDHSTDRLGNIHYSLNARAFAYRIGLGEDGLADFYERCWIYDDDDQATRTAKNKAFRELAIDMVPVASATAAGSGGSVREAAASALGGLIIGLENRIPEWEVAVGIIDTKPLRAKIGTKEGLKNGDRYRAYSYTEDRSGNLKSVKRGYLRATTVASNTGMSMGETEPSEFYQISGLTSIEDGWTIKQSNDAGVGVLPFFKAGGVSTVSFGLDIDILFNVKTSGAMSYGFATLGIDPRAGDYSAIYFGIGYGYALHFTRLLEVMPYGLIGLDHLGLSGDDTSGSDSRFTRASAFILEPGIRTAINVAYPLQVFAKLSYDLLLYGQTLNDIYYRYNENLDYYYNDKHKSGLGLQFGAKWTF